MGRKKQKKLTGILLAVALMIGTLAGCGGNGASGDGMFAGGETGGKPNSGNAGGKGRFIESELPLPEGTQTLYAMEKLQDGSVMILGYNREELKYFTAQTSDFNGDWTVQILDWAAESYVAGGAVKNDGTAALLQVSYAGGNVSNEVALIGTDKTVEMLTLAMPENLKEDGCRDIRFDGAGNLLVQTVAGSILRADEATGSCEVYCDLEGGYSGFFGVAGKWIAAVTSPAGIRLFDSADGSPVSEDALLNEMIASDASLTDRNSEYGAGLAFAGGMEENAILYVNYDGVFHHSMGGSVSEQLINGELNSIGDTSANFLQLVMLDEEHIFLALIDGTGTYKILQYTYDKDAPAVPGKELKVYALKDSDYLRHIVSVYQRNHQDVYVNLTIGMSGQDAVTAEDAIRALNTDILAGAGPDVLILDGLPAEDYVEKGILADISPIVEEIAEADGVFENIVFAMKRENGAIYGMPTRFYFHMAGGDADALAAGRTLPGLADYGEQLKADGVAHVFGGETAKRLLNKLYEAGAAGFLAADGTIDESALKDWLSAAKRIYDVDEHTEIEVTGIRDNSVHSTHNMFGILLKESRATIGSLVSANEISTINAVKTQENVDYDVLNGDGQSVFVPYQMVGIVNETALYTEAEAFVRMMLGSEYASVDGNGFPVNRAAYDAICEGAKNQYDEYRSGGIAVSTTEGVSVEADLGNLTEADIGKLTGILESLKTPAPTNAVIRELVIGETEKYLLGQASQEDALASILQKCRLYLSE